MNIFKKIWDLFQPIKNNNMPDDDNIPTWANEANGEAVIDSQLTKVVGANNGTISNTNEESFLESLPEIKRTIFFDTIRTTLFAGHLTENQVQGITAILNEWDRRELKDLRWLAYLLGTVFWESGRTMRPVEEIGKGHGLFYGVPNKITGKIYYGRGRVQLTLYDNYLKFERLLHIPLTTQPELMLTDEVDIQVLFMGMIEGLYTGKKLADYFNDKITDWHNARKIINPNDKKTYSTIAAFSMNFLGAL